MTNDKQIYREVSKCRVCGNRQLVDILSLGDLYVTSFLDDQHNLQERAPLDLVLCREADGGCGLLQLKHTTSQAVMYEHYWYRSGINATMTNELKGIAKVAEEMTGLGPNDFVIDIGSNDSTLLRSYSEPRLNRIGFEPAKNLMEYAKPGVSHVFNTYFNQKTWAERYGTQKAKVITAIGMFYDLDDPNAFVADVARLLDDDGVFVIQQNYLGTMLKDTIFDNISHEHLEYYSLRSLNHLLQRHNLETFDLDLNDVNGGSIRTYIRHIGKGAALKIQPGASDRIGAVRAAEERQQLDELACYQDYAARVQALRRQLHGFVSDEVRNGRTVYVYGASTRGNTVLQYCNLDQNLIVAAADRNPDKWGKRTVGSNIPIVSEADARAKKPDYFLVLPYQFINEFVQREASFLKGGGKFIVPLPEFRILDASAIV